MIQLGLERDVEILCTELGITLRERVYYEDIKRISDVDDATARMSIDEIRQRYEKAQRGVPKLIIDAVLVPTSLTPAQEEVYSDMVPAVRRVSKPYKGCFVIYEIRQPEDKKERVPEYRQQLDKLIEKGKISLQAVILKPTESPSPLASPPHIVWLGVTNNLINYVEFEEEARVYFEGRGVPNPSDRIARLRWLNNQPYHGEQFREALKCFIQ